MGKNRKNFVERNRPAKFKSYLSAALKLQLAKTGVCFDQLMLVAVDASVHVGGASLGCLVYSILGQKLRRITLADLSYEFCKLPRHEEMSDAFIASRGKYGRAKFKEDFDAPDWAYDFLRELTGHAGGDDPDYEGVDPDPFRIRSAG